MPPVPLTNYTDAQIRSEVIGTGGSVPTSNYTFMDLVNASDFSRFDPTYLAGASNKGGLVNSDQFRNYPIAVSCPSPSYTVSYNLYYTSIYSILYHVNITNMVSGRGYDTSFINEYGFTGGIVSDDGNGNLYISKDMRSQVTIKIRFKAFGSCGVTNWVDFIIVPNYLHPLPVLSPPSITSNGQCVSGSTSATLTGISLSGGTVVWSDGQTGSPILANYAVVWRAWARNSNGYSLASNSVNVYNC